VTKERREVPERDLRGSTIETEGYKKKDALSLEAYTLVHGDAWGVKRARRREVLKW